MTLEHPPARQQFSRPGLFTEELADRWGITTITVSRIYAKLGLKPIRVGKRLIFPIDQIEAAEARSMK